MKKLLIVLFPFLLMGTEMDTALDYYYELGYKCVPKTLSVDSVEYLRNDTVFVMKYDANNIPWVVDTKKKEIQ
jgi:hypothetical protein